MIQFRIQIVLCLVSLWAEPLLAQENWPEFRGPTGNGMAVGSSLPIDVADKANLKWKTAIHGKGWSSPVVWGNHIWLTTATEDGKQMSAICIDLETGKVIHDKIIHENESPSFCHPTNSYASPTPAIEEGRVYLHFGSYGTTCLDTETGKVVWQRTDLNCDHFRGPASSPVLYENKLIIAFDGFDFQYVVALDTRTGETLWKTDRDIDYGTDNGDLKKAYGTAAVFKVEGKPIVVCPSAVATVAYDIETGIAIWTHYHGGMNVSSRPVRTASGLIILTNGMGKMFAVDPLGSGDITKSNTAWSLSRGVAKKSSQLVINNRLYMVSDRGIASCLNVEDGQTIWQERLGGAFSASPIFDGEKIFAFGETGEIHVFKPADKFSLLAQAKLGDGFKASPAVVGNRLILRSLTHLYSISK